MVRHFLIFVLSNVLKLYFYPSFFPSLSVVPFLFFSVLVSCIHLSLFTISIIFLEVILGNSSFVDFINFIDRLINFFLSAGDAFTCRRLIFRLSSLAGISNYLTCFIIRVLFLTFLFFISRSSKAFSLSSFILLADSQNPLCYLNYLFLILIFLLCEYVLPAPTASALSPIDMLVF